MKTKFYVICAISMFVSSTLWGQQMSEALVVPVEGTVQLSELQRMKANDVKSIQFPEFQPEIFLSKEDVFYSWVKGNEPLTREQIMHNITVLEQKRSEVQSSKSELEANARMEWMAQCERTLEDLRRLLEGATFPIIKAMSLVD
jgi:hypothetical protein